MPVVDEKAGNKGNNAWKTLIQFKTLADGTKCAFRWSKISNNGYSYLKIECLVVNESMNDASNINWDDENVETRIFKGSGYITAIRNYWQYSNGRIDYYYYTPRPMEWGYYDASIIYNNYNYTNSRVSLDLTKSCMTYGGFYWTSDADQATFTMIFDNSTGYTLGYYLSIYKQAIAANIRCVKAE